MRFLFTVLFFVMVYFTLVQYNDPDPLRWMLMYGYAALVMGLAAYRIKIISNYMLWVGYAVFGFSFITLTPSIWTWLTAEQGQNLMQPMQASKMYIEEAREGLGSLICMVCVGLVHFVKLKRNK